MTTFYLKSDEKKDMYFEIDSAKPYTVNAPLGICQKFYFPSSEILEDKLSLDERGVNNIMKYSIAPDSSFELNKIKILELQNDIQIIINNYGKIASQANIEEIHNSDLFDVPELIKSNWKYANIYYDLEKTEQMLISLSKDIIEIGNRAIKNNEDLCIITM